MTQGSGGSMPTDGNVRRRIGLVEDHESVALGLRSILADQSDLDLIAVAATVDELLASGRTLDLVVLDLRLGDGSSPRSNVEQLHAAGAQVLVYTGAENPFLVRSAARAGVLGVVRKSEPAAAIVSAIRRAAAGGQVVTTDWAAAIDGDPQLPDVGLSPRQREVLALYASGEKAGRVARLAGLSEQTVNDYLVRIRNKYAQAGRPAPTKTDLYKRAVEDGWLPMPEVPPVS
ncbi:response regulator transcription factor [Rhodococcus sp. PAMC28707]|uniref:response regulator transcription factor n=1 Tax=unclassified Rhodococcus (in: high G+C Gram-positive bacteria) TaxID=192944 RepID=UPI00109DB2B6|nr:MULTISPECIES: response regulator transcription factor [unclassified Rhodococcus (in: high G+C Gram-positive bacteria)]QCB49410.1 response regulator transcription factor [Rhodococcus sp. PAMC28705]QCB58902.1 response regulator transcription factor [Rhodococcus sp. PAMC28707]